MCLFQHLPLHCRIELTEEKKLKFLIEMIRLNKKTQESQKGERIVFMSGHGYVKGSFFRFIIQS